MFSHRILILLLVVARWCAASVLQPMTSVDSELSLAKTLAQLQKPIRELKSKSSKGYSTHDAYSTNKYRHSSTSARNGRSDSSDSIKYRRAHNRRSGSNDEKSSKSLKGSKSSKSGKSRGKGSRSRYQYGKSSKDSKSEKSSKSSKSGKSYKGSKSGKSYKDSKSAKSYKGSKSAKSYKGNKSGKSSKDSKSAKSYKGSKSGKSSVKHSGSGYSLKNDDWKEKYSIYYYWYWYKYWKENVKTPHEEVKVTQAPTSAPTIKPGGLFQDHGYVGCYPKDEVGNKEESGNMKKRELAFSYTLETTSNGNNDMDVKDAVQAVERAFVEYLGGKILNCESTTKKSPKNRRLDLTRKLALLGYDSSPEDTVINTDQCDSFCCGSNCYNIGASMSVFTDQDDENLCYLGKELSDFAQNYESDSIEGVSGIGIHESSLSLDGKTCSNADIPNSVVTIIQDDNNDTLLSALLYPFLILALLLFAAFLFVRRRRRRRYEEEESLRLRNLNELEVEEDDLAYAYGAGYRKYALNAVNVHKCHSAQCASCSDRRNETEFLPLENVSKWIAQKENQRDPKLHTIREDSPTNISGDQEERDMETLRIREAARRVLQDGYTPIDEVDADRYDDRLRGLPTVPEASDSDDTEKTSRRVFRTDMETGSV